VSREGAKKNSQILITNNYHKKKAKTNQDKTEKTPRKSRDELSEHEEGERGGEGRKKQRPRKTTKGRHKLLAGKKKKKSAKPFTG